jgi:hypothetical protein
VQFRSVVSLEGEDEEEDEEEGKEDELLHLIRNKAKFTL